MKDLKKRFKRVPMVHLTIDTEDDSLPGWKIKRIEKN